MKDLQSWKEAPLDCMVLSLYRLQAYYYNEIKRGLSGLGQYTVSLSHSLIQVQEFDYLPTSSPEEIVKRIQDGEITDTEQPQGLPGPPADISDKKNNMSSLARAQDILKAGQNLKCNTI